MYRITTLLLAGALSQNLLANSSIQKATLSKKTGSLSIEITGSGFDAENPMLFWDNISDTYNEKNMMEGDIVSTSTADLWREKTNQWGKPFSFKTAEIRNDGTAVSSNSSSTNQIKKSPIYYGTGHKNYLGSPNHSNPERIKNEIFVSWWYKPSKSPSAEGGSNKFIRIWDDTNGNGTRISWTQMHLTCGDVTIWGNWNGTVNDWNHHMIHVNLQESNVKTWVNGTLIHNGKCSKSTEHPDAHLYVGLIGFDHGSNAYAAMETYIDDIYIASSQARVEISNDSQWSPLMEKEILPITSWSDTKIIALRTDGKIKFSSENYVYVIDSKGNVNKNGIRLDCPSCPTSAIDASN